MCAPKYLRLLLPCMLYLWAGFISAAETPPTIVVIDFSLRDDMVPGPGRKAPGAEAVARRTIMLRDWFIDKLQNSANYELIEIDRENEDYKQFLKSRGALYDCKECISSYAATLNTDYVLHGWVQRVSNLIINFNVEILEVKSGKVYDRSSVDTRGNTDKSWLDGVSYLQRHLRYEL